MGRPTDKPEAPRSPWRRERAADGRIIERHAEYGWIRSKAGIVLRRVPLGENQEPTWTHGIGRFADPPELPEGDTSGQGFPD